MQGEDEDMVENREENEERCTGGDEESDMTEEREPQLETLVASKNEGVFLFLSFFILGMKLTEM